MDKTTKDLNRIKLVLVEKNKTNRWLAQQIGKDEATTSQELAIIRQPDNQEVIFSKHSSKSLKTLFL